jgi:nitric oxide reductase NorE protein
MSEAVSTSAPRERGASRPRHMPGEEGIWLFIFGDMMVFTLFFIVFAWARGEQLELYREAQQHLSQFFGALNTFFMLTSSWFVATAVRAARGGDRRLTVAGFGGGVLCAIGFGANKFFEYGDKIHAGITPATNDFFMYYYVFTGIHFMHVIIGMSVLAFMANYARTAPALDARVIKNLESGASFWHVVDLLWIVLFALLYLAP